MANPPTVGSNMNMAAQIFGDMVMEEAIKDKTIQVKEQLKDQEGTLIDPDKVEELLFKGPQEQDEDDGQDEEEEKIMRGIRERRLGEIKN